GSQAGQNSSDYFRHGEPAAQMQPRRPPHLEVVDVLSRRVNAQLQRRALERCRRLQYRDGVVEIRDVGSLRGSIRRRHHPQRAGQIEALLCGELLRGRRSHGTVEVTVQLGLSPALELAYDSE